VNTSQPAAMAPQFIGIVRYGNQCCGSGMFIPDPKTATKERDEKKFIVKPFLVATNFTELKIILFLNAEEKIWASFQRIIELFTQKLSLSSKRYGVRIRDPEKTYSRSRIRVQGSKRHWIPDPQH
jgi:hypothetical protein